MKVRLTERIIESLKTTMTQEDVFHTPTPSAGLRLTREGRKTWFVYYRSPVVVDGKGQPKLRRLYLGEHRTGKAGQGKYLALEEFRQAYEMIRGTLARGIDPQSGAGAPIPAWAKNSGHVPAASCSEALDEVRSASLLPALERLSDSKTRDVYSLILASACRPGEAAGVRVPPRPRRRASGRCGGCGHWLDGRLGHRSRGLRAITSVKRT